MVHDATNGLQLQTLQGHSRAICVVQYSKQGELIYAASHDGLVAAWDATGGQSTPTVSSGFDSRLIYSPDSTWLASVKGLTRFSGERVGRGFSVWDIASQKLLADIECKCAFVAFSEIPEQIIGFSGKSIDIWDIKKRELISSEQLQVPQLPTQGEMRGSAYHFSIVGVNSDQSRCISYEYPEVLKPGDEEFSEGPGKLKIWDVKQGNLVVELDTKFSDLNGAAFDAVGKLVAFWNDSNVYLSDVKTGATKLAIKTDAPNSNSVCFSRDGSRLLTASKTSVVAWDTSSGKRLIELTGLRSNVMCVAYSPDGTRIVTGLEDGSIKIWFADTGEELLTLRGHTGPVTELVFSPNGQQLSSVSEDRTIKFWLANSPAK